RTYQKFRSDIFQAVLQTIILIEIIAESYRELTGAAMRLIFINRFFFPDHSATSQILSDLAFFLAGFGHEVHIITSRQRYDNPRASLSSKESIRGVRIHRVRTTRFGRRHLLGRIIDYLSFYLTVQVALLRRARGGDIVVAKTDPPLLSIP